MTVVNRAVAGLSIKQIGKNLRNLNKKSAEYRDFRQENLCSLIHQMQHSGSGAELLAQHGKDEDRIPSIFALFTSAKERAQASAFLIKFGPVRSFFDGTKGGIKFDSSLVQNRQEGAVNWGRDVDTNENPLFIEMIESKWYEMEGETEDKPFLSMTVKEQEVFAANLPEAERAPYTVYLKALEDSKEILKAAQEAKKDADKVAQEAFKAATVVI